MRKQLISFDQAKTAKEQHTKPCSDCPLARTSIPSWLGSSTTEEYVYLLLSDHRVDCHTVKKKQCAGVSIFRANIFKSPRDKRVLSLGQDKELVFADIIEFAEHHGLSPLTEANRRMAGDIPRRFKVDMRMPTVNWDYIEDQVMRLRHGASWKAKFRRGNEAVHHSLINGGPRE